MKLKYNLRSWQGEALNKWKRNNSKGIVEVITGGGKTVFAEACILDLIKIYKNLNVLIIVPTVALLDQWVVSLIEELYIPENEISVSGGGRKAKNVAKINISVINTARKLTKKLTANGDWFLIVDECHRIGSIQNRKALLGKFVATLGLSATPDRQYDDALDVHVIPILGDIIYRYGLKQARYDKIITPFNLLNVEFSLLPDEENEYKKLTRRIGIITSKHSEIDESESKIEALLRARARVINKATMRIPVTVKIVENNRGKRIMIFHEDIIAANKIYRILKEKKHSVTIYHTKIGHALRISNLLLFRKGIFDVMIACRALDEGINIPETQIAIIASSTATTRQRIQRLGRVLRPSINKDAATIYTLYATETEKNRLKKESMQISDMIAVKWMKVNAKY